MNYQHNKTLLILIQLYIVQGIPVGLAFDAYPVLLRNAGVSLAEISMIPLASLPWVIKFFWAPVIENYWSARVGKRKSWLMPMQFLLFSFILVIALTPFSSENTSFLLLIIILSSFAGATQDIATDGLATDETRRHSLNKINTIQASGSILGMLIGGAGVTLLTDYIGKTNSIMLVAALVLISTLNVFFWREPVNYRSENAPLARVRLFFRREHAYRMLFLALLVPSAGSVVYGIAKLVLIDSGFSISEVGAFTGIGGYLAMFMGCIIASRILRRFSIYRTLTGAISLLGISCLIWVSFYHSPQMMTFTNVLLVMALIGMSIGTINVSIYSLLMKYVASGKQSTTDYSVFQSSLLFSEIIAASLSIAIAEQFGYTVALFTGTLAACATLYWIWRITTTTAPESYPQVETE